MRAITAENEKKKREQILQKALNSGYLLPEHLKDDKGNWKYKVNNQVVFKIKFDFESWNNSKYYLWFAPLYTVQDRLWNQDEYTFMPEDSSYVGKSIMLDSSYLSCGVKSLHGIDTLYTTFKDKTKEALVTFLNALYKEFNNIYKSKSLVNPNGIILISTEIPKPSEARTSFASSRFDRRDYLNENFEKLDIRIINPNSSNLIQVWGYAQAPYEEKPENKKDD